MNDFEQGFSDELKKLSFDFGEALGRASSAVGKAVQPFRKHLSDSVKGSVDLAKNTYGAPGHEGLLQEKIRGFTGITSGMKKKVLSGPMKTQGSTSFGRIQSAPTQAPAGMQQAVLEGKGETMPSHFIKGVRQWGDPAQGGAARTHVPTQPYEFAQSRYAQE